MLSVGVKAEMGCVRFCGLSSLRETTILRVKLQFRFFFGKWEYRKFAIFWNGGGW
jgi:hypothetical protein